MTISPKYKLFFLKENRFFDEGELFELADEIVSEASLDNDFGQKFNPVPPETYDNFGHFLPDKGDGLAGFVHEKDVLECPYFAENVPPGNCPVKITSKHLRSRADALFDENLNNLKIFDVRVEQNLHYQKIVVPLPPDFPVIQLVTLKNRLKNVEIDSYENPSLENRPEGKAYCLHIGHVPPGFYEARINLPKAKYIKLTFIKFFPAHFREKYPFRAADQVEEKPESFSVGEVGFHAANYLNKPLKTNETRENQFSAELLNVALEIKTEWGENFGKPINERILRKFPALTSAEIEELNKIARRAESFIYHLAERELDGEIAESEIVGAARHEFTWLNDSNVYRLKNIGMFYARR